MSAATLENTACEPSVARDDAAATCERLIREQIPNLFRLWLNPHVAQACYCLAQLADADRPPAAAGRWQVFLANSGDEALSGAVKLARFAARWEGRSSRGVLVDDTRQFGHFALTEFSDGRRIEYIPGLDVCADLAGAARIIDPATPPGFVIVRHAALNSAAGAQVRERLAACGAEQRPALVVSLSIEDARSTSGPPRCDANLSPDMVVFDETWTRREVPFGAFVGRKRFFRYWNRRGMSTFHSTTFQPNSVSSLHLLRCLRELLPVFVRQHAAALKRIERDRRVCEQTFRDLYSRPLARLIRVTGFDRGEVRAAGHYIRVNGRRIFDAVAGVACSLRGHNPPDGIADLQDLGSVAVCRDELTERLQSLTGLAHATPAVSGAAAVEQALKIGLAGQFPRQHVLALRGGFGGKTLFALTGTWKPSLKSGLDPLYPHVTYIDPFAPDACAQIADAFRRWPIGVIQLEFVQAVGGVRAVPGAVLDCLRFLRARHDCLLFVDEVQTGMYRTGPFVRSRAFGLAPDLLTIGKGTSDMLFPCALTLHSDDVQDRLARQGCRLAESLSERFGFEHGYRTMVGGLRWAESQQIGTKVAARGQTFADLLHSRLSGCPNVREIRSFGLLVGIELDLRRRSQAWLRRSLPQLLLLGMLQHPEFPVLVGFCQYEPHVLKLTPPLTVTDDELDRCAATIAAVLWEPVVRSVGRVARLLAVAPFANRVHNLSSNPVRP